MTQNPYESPRIANEHPPAAQRDAALLAIRVALAILLLPAFFNYYWFDAQVLGERPQSFPFQPIARGVNVTGIMLIAILVWFLALRMLEGIATLSHRLLGPRVALGQWHAALYLSLRRAPYLAIGGAILWFAWVIGFYLLRANFLVISYAVGIPAHLLAACLYGPLLYRWYALWRGSKLTLP